MGHHIIYLNTCQAQERQQYKYMFVYYPHHMNLQLMEASGALVLPCDDARDWGLTPAPRLSTGRARTPVWTISKDNQI